MQITEDRKKQVIDLYFNQYKTYAEIAEIERISPRDIHTIIKEEEARRLQYKLQQQQEEKSSKAYNLFSKGKTPVEVAILLNLREPEATKLYREYWKLKQLHKLTLIYKETNGKLWPLLKLYRLIKEKGMNIDQVVNVVEIAIHKLPYMETLYKQIKDEVNKLQYTRQHLSNDIEARKNKLLLLDKIAFASEQDCRRKHQEIQELTHKKDRIERLIANILNGEAYSKLRQIVKENVKAVLSDNKILISTAFAAIILTLKTDPEIVKLIQNIQSANDEEQHIGNNVTKYFESNKDRIMDLSKKNYENLIEALTNNVIKTAAAASSSNPTLSLPSSSSSTFSAPSDQSDIYGIEKLESFHNNKGDSDD